MKLMDSTYCVPDYQNPHVQSRSRAAEISGLTTRHCCQTAFRAAAILEACKAKRSSTLGNDVGSGKLVTAPVVGHKIRRPKPIAKVLYAFLYIPSIMVYALL